VFSTALQKRIVSLQRELIPIQQAISMTMNILEDISQAFYMCENAKDFDSCSKCEKIYVAANQVLAPHLIHPRKER
jgi:hypothetical protein